jgi:uncharacterized protein (TIGR02996 family)
VITLADAFLQSICQSPDDDAPRLIFADWLDENGDPDRAEFIRIQCRLEHTLEDADDRPDLEERAAAQLERHRDAWVAPLKGKVDWLWQFQRGFPAHVSVSAQTFLESGASLFELAPVREARMGNVRCDFSGPGNQHDEYNLTPELAACPTLARLRGLGIRYSSFEWGQDITTENVLTPDDLYQLLHSPHLGNLTDLSLNLPLGVEGAWALARSGALGGLESLNLDSSNLTGEGVAALAASPHLGRLQRLSLVCGRLGNRSIGAPGVAALAQAPFLERLTHLDLRDNDLPPGTVSSLLRSGRLGSLSHLDVGGPTRSEEDLLTLAGVRELARLNYLGLIGFSGGDEAAFALAGAQHLTRVADLSLDYNRFSAAGMAALAASPLFARLHRLSLRDSRVMGDEGAAALAASPHPPRLRSLSLGDCGLTDKGARALAESPYLAELRRLNLEDNQLGVEGIEALASSPVLRPDLGLRLWGIGSTGNPLSRAEALALRERYGEHKIPNLP